MADINNLKERVTKAEEKVEKCKKTIERHEKAIVNKIAKLEKIVGEGIKDFQALKDNARNSEDLGYSSWDVYEIEGKQDDLKGAKRKLEDAERILAGHEERLAVEIEKERFLEGNAPQVIKDFLEEWKEMAYEWHVKRYDDYLRFSKALDKRVEEFEKEIGIQESMMPNRTQRVLLEEAELDWRSVGQRKASFAGQAVLKMVEIGDESKRLAWLNKMLEEEKKAKMLDLINRISNVVGTITDAKALTINGGNLNGIIIGEKAKAEVQTITAGGWNIQCWHYRTLVREL